MLPIKIDLPENFLEEEHRCGYMVTTKRKKIWSVELDLLNEFQKVCKQYNLQYYAAAGTLLGAVRHHGYIPWDDDIDVMMFRDDYDRLVSVAHESFQPPYFFHTTIMAERCLRGHAQLRNSLTTAILQTDFEQKRTFNQGIFMDIFVLDGYSEKGYLAASNLRKMRVYKKILSNKVNLTPETKQGRALHRALEAIERGGFDFQKLYERYEDMARKMPIYDSGYVTDIIYRNPPKYIHKVSDFGEGVDMAFEFMHVRAPQNYKSYLKDLYGDYMQPVNVPSGHDVSLYDPERPFSEYLR